MTNQPFNNSKKISKSIIIEATIALAKKGGSISLRKIAAQANCAPPSIYYYFRNKKQIMTAVFEHIFLKEGVEINIDEITKYFNENMSVFDAMFSGDTNVDGYKYVDTSGKEGAFALMIGTLILEGASDVKQSEQ